MRLSQHGFREAHFCLSTSMMLTSLSRNKMQKGESLIVRLECRLTWPVPPPPLPPSPPTFLLLPFCTHHPLLRPSCSQRLASRSYVAASCAASQFPAFMDKPSPSRNCASTWPSTKRCACDALNGACTTGGRCSEEFAHLIRAGPSRQHTTTSERVSRQSDLRCCSMYHSCSQITRTEQQTHVSKQ